MPRFLFASCRVVISSLSRDLYNPMQLVVPSAVRMADMIEARRRPINGDLSDEEFWEEDELYKELLEDDKDWADDEDEFGKDNI